jgi:hypothetical protein
VSCITSCHSLDKCDLASGIGFLTSQAQPHPSSVCIYLANGCTALIMYGIEVVLN